MIFKDILITNMNEFKMRFELKIVKFFNYLESENVSISGHTNKYLIEKYYNYIGFRKESTMEEWFKGLATNKYPTHNILRNAIKKARNYELKWRRNTNQRKELL